MQPQPRAITTQDIFNIPGLFLGLAALLVLIVGAGSQDVTTIVIALMMGFSAVLSLGFIASPLLQGMFPVLGISTAFGVVLLLAALVPAARGVSHWTVWVTLIAALISLFAAFRAIVLKKF